MIGDPAPPVIDGLTFVRKLGSGGFADVFLYDQATPQRKVAVKVLRETGLSNAALQGFAAEANAMAQLEHPHIVPVYSTGTTRDHRPYIVMTYYPKPSLAERAHKERFSVAETLRLGIQLGSAVETAHRAGLLHRDIKPANVLTNAYDKPGLTDFGIAGQMSDQDDQDLGVSVPWSPPETLYATGPATVRSDVYSLAATLWHVLVGRSPFQVQGGDNSAFAMMRRVRDVAPPPTGRADVPASLDRLLRTAMSKDPGLRPSSALEFTRALQAIEQEQRLDRTPIELAVEDPTGMTMPNIAVIDRTQIKAPQVVSPAAALTPVSGPAGSLGGLGVDTAETHRAAPRVDPISAYSEDVHGVTMLRGQPPPEAPVAEAPPSAPRDRGWIAALAVLLVLVAGGVGWLLVRANTTPKPGATSSIAEDPPDVGAVLPPPGRPQITCRTAKTSVTCTWTYANPDPSDRFDWRIKGTTSQQSTAKPEAVINSPAAVCIEVKVVRASGYIQPEWTRGPSATCS